MVTSEGLLFWRKAAYDGVTITQSLDIEYQKYENLALKFAG